MSFFSQKIVTPWDLLQKALPESDLDDFEFGLPLITVEDDQLGKSERKQKKNRRIQGVASTPDKDLQDEYVIQKGLDLRYFLQHGYFNNDHKPGFENKVGKPTKAEIKKVKDKSGKSLLGLWVEGYLWPLGTHKVADAIWELAGAIVAAEADRDLGFSIQGKVLKRENSRIVQAWVQDIAITPSPVNTATWMEVVEGLSKGLWATAEEVEVMRKSIGPEAFVGEPIVDELWETEKALSAAGSVLAPESLEERLKLNLPGTASEDEEDEISKAVDLAYKEMRHSGFSEDLSRRSALAAVARSILA